MNLRRHFRKITILTLVTFCLSQHITNHVINISPPNLTNRIPCISLEQNQQLQSVISANINSLKQQGKYEFNTTKRNIEFIFPLRANDNFEGYNFYITRWFVDHNDSYPGYYQDYNCGDRTIDFPNGINHEGTDYDLAPFPWHMMQNESIEIVAAADGMILEKQEGLPYTNCGGNTEDIYNWNGVIVQHNDLSILEYIHMKAVTSKDIGDWVSQGEYLGLVGSSGWSDRPHIHFAYYKEPGWTPDLVIDPYSGACDSSSYWINQNPYYDSAILRVMTHSYPPEPQECPQTTIIHEKNVFEPQDDIWIGVYHRDHLDEQESIWRIYRPNGSLFNEYVDIYNGEFKQETWRFRYMTIPFDATLFGTWRIEIQFLDEIYEHHFNIQTNQITGDINYDNEINILDIVILANMVVVSEYDEIVDLNEDGLVTVLDLVILVDWVLFPN